MLTLRYPGFQGIGAEERKVTWPSFAFIPGGISKGLGLRVEGFRV